MRRIVDTQTVSYCSYFIYFKISTSFKMIADSKFQICPTEPKTVIGLQNSVLWCILQMMTVHANI